MTGVHGVLEIEAFAGRPIDQVAMVVRDFDAALARWSALVHTGRWRTLTLGTKDHVRTEYRGRPKEFSARLALNDQTPQLELVQPLEGASTHRDWLDGAWAYFDTSAALGVMLEAIEPASELPRDD